MSLASGEQRVLAEIEEALRRSDPKLARALTRFNRQSGRQPNRQSGRRFSPEGSREALPRREFLLGTARRPVQPRPTPSAGSWDNFVPARPRRGSSRMANAITLILGLGALALMVAFFALAGRDTVAVAPPVTGCSVHTVGLCRAVPDQGGPLG